MPRITLEQINEAVGMPLTASFICDSLDIAPDADQTWDAKQYGVILGRLQNHVLLRARKTIDAAKAPDPVQSFLNGFF